MIFSVLFVIIIVALLMWRDSRKPDNFPPGPPWLPVVGVLPLVRKLLDFYSFHHLVWHHFYKKYGGIVGLRVANQTLVLVAGREAVKEFYATDAFNGRPDGFFYQVRTFNKRFGVVFSDGEYWSAQRKFSVKVLRQMGMGRSAMIEHLEEEAASMVDHFRKLSRVGTIEMRHAFDIPVLNILWAMLAGYRFDFEDARVNELVHLIHESFRVIDMTGGLLNLYPWIRHIAPNLSGYTALLNTHKPLWNFLKEVVEDKSNTLLSKEKCQTFIESYLLEMLDEGKGASTTGKVTFSDEELLSLCVDFVQAGTETTSNTLSFGLMYMIHNQRVCDKIHDELDTIVGRQRLPSLGDRNKLPYLEAVLCEIQRFASVAPLAIAHRNTDAVKLMNYTIPKNTIALVSLYSMNMDEEYWCDPHAFRPERFLNENNELLLHSEQFIPFGQGKRRCIGENIARSSLFVYFAAFMHAFQMVVPPDTDLPDIEPVDGITLQPKSFKINLIRRL